MGSGRPAPPWESPNRYAGELSCEVRCFWTPLTPWEDVEQALADAHQKALTEARERHAATS